ncbi:MAG: hypothetical protein QM691_00190 [Opitutaceae bacterium]
MPLPHRLRLVLLFCTSVALFAPFAAAAPKWSTLQAPHCLVVSQLSERDTRAWATRFEEFTAALRSRLVIVDSYLPPLTVVLFADSRQFDPYRPRATDGKKREVAGFFASRDTWGVIGLADAFTDEQTRHVVLHEATHWYVSATRTELPLWLNEGFAEVFSTFREERGQGILGDPIPYHVATLRGSDWLSLEQLLITTTRDSRYTDSRRNGVFYAQAWLFTHELLFELSAANKETLNRFFAARIEGKDQLTAIQAACGKDLATIARDLENYVRDGTFQFAKMPLPADTKVTAPFAPAPSFVVETALARVALGANRLELARKHTDQALALDGASPTAHELLAALERQSNNAPAAAAAAQAAIDRGSRDAWMHFLVGDALGARASDRGELPENAREMARCFAAAISLQPGLRPAYDAYARIAPMLPSVTQEDAALLGTGYKRFPDAPELLIGLAAILQKGHNEQQAGKILDLALSRGELLTEAERANAESLRVRWRADPLMQKIREQEQAKQFADALATCEQLLQEALPLRERRIWEQRRSQLRFRVSFQEALQLLKEKHIDEGLAKLEVLLVQPELNETQRNQVRRLIEGVRHAPHAEPES